MRKQFDTFDGKQLTDQLNGFFDAIRDTFEEHLSAINQNTREVEENFGHICRIEQKLDTLTSQMTKIQSFLAVNFGLEEKDPQAYNIKPLSTREKKVFLTLYTLDNAQNGCSLRELAKALHMPENILYEYVLSLIDKGIPVRKSLVNGLHRFHMDADFKTLQAKRNVVGIEQSTFVKF